MDNRPPSCDGRVVKALDSNSNRVSPRRFEPCSQRDRFAILPMHAKVSKLLLSNIIKVTTISTQSAFVKKKWLTICFKTRFWFFFDGFDVLTEFLSNCFQMSEVILSGKFPILKSLGPRFYVADQIKTVLAGTRSCLRSKCYVLLSVTKLQTTETTVICNGNGNFKHCVGQYG